MLDDSLRQVPDSHPLLLKIYQQQSYGGPYQFAYADYQCNENSCASRQRKAGGRHDKAALAASELQRKEKQEVGKQAGERQYEHALQERGMYVWKHEQDEHYLECRTEAARKLEQNGGNECLGVLVVQRGYLAVYGVKLLLVLFDEPTRPLLQAGNVAHDVHQPNCHAFTIALQEKPHAKRAENSCRRKQHADKEVDTLGKQVNQDGKKPENEMAEDMGHGIKDDRRRGALGANLRRQRHYAVRLAAHKAAGGCVIEGEARHGNLVKPEEADTSLAAVSAPYDNVPRGRVEQIQQPPQANNGEKPIAGARKPVPHLAVIKLGEHDRKHGYAENKKQVLVFLFH